MDSIRSRTASSTSATRPINDSRPAMRRKSAIRPAAVLIARSRLETLRYPVVDRRERLRQRLGIGAARLRHVRPSAALAADLQGDEVHQVAGLHPGDEVLRHAGDEAHLL